MTRLFLVALIIILIARAFYIYGSEGVEGKSKKEPVNKQPKTRKGVPKEVGEYVEYEEVKK
jgi:hypothetical protein